MGPNNSLSLKMADVVLTMGDHPEAAVWTVSPRAPSTRGCDGPHTSTSSTPTWGRGGGELIVWVIPIHGGNYYFGLYANLWENNKGILIVR